jgi:AcrR family transcriptional regulator
MNVRSNVRDDLLAAAEELFAAGGLDGVSLREITSAAGATNASAVQYHFGNREGLIHAVVARHDAAVEIRRHALLDEIESGPITLRPLVAALVRPYAAELDQPGGAGYLRVVADLLNHPRFSTDWTPKVEGATSTTRWRALIKPLLDPEAVRRHRRFLALRFTVTELARRAGQQRRQQQRFVNELIDLNCGLLLAPVTP